MLLAAHQPQFCPWLGFFDKMRRADLFVLLDDVQFKKNEWQNRNRVKTPRGPVWLTVPVRHRFGRTIRETEIESTVDWRRKHRATLEQSYGKAPHYGAAEPFVRELTGRDWSLLGELNLFTIDWLAGRLGVGTERKLSSEDPVEGAATERLVNLCRRFGADAYLAGAGGRDYMDMALFERAGIRVEFQDYRHPEYPQLHGPFTPNLSALDLVMNAGPESGRIAFA